MLRGFKADFSLYQILDASGSWGFELVLNKKVRIKGEPYETDTEAAQAARLVGKELALIVTGPIDQWDPKGAK